MKTLVIFYSRTNSTKKVAEDISVKLGAKLEEITDLKDRKGVKGYMIAGKDAIKGKKTEIKHNEVDLDDYDLVVIGTPVWVGTMTPAIRTFLENNIEKLQKVAFFSTQGSPKRQRVFDDLAILCKKSPISELLITTKEAKQNNYKDKLNSFIENVKEIDNKA